MIFFVRKHYRIFCIFVYFLYLVMLGTVLYCAIQNNIFWTSIFLFIFLGITMIACNIEEKASKYIEDPIE